MPVAAGELLDLLGVRRRASAASRGARRGGHRLVSGHGFAGAQSDLPALRLSRPRTSQDA